jgi:hypothetical protein
MNRVDEPNGREFGELPASLPRSAEVVIVGGGVNGLSTAF